MAKASKSDEHESAFTDVSDEVEQAEKDAQADPEYDDDGNVTNLTSEAAAEVAAEQAKRAQAQANGGGPWPADLVQERFIGSTPLRAARPEYTSHEDAK
jgi:hypothetical protein